MALVLIIKFVLAVFVAMLTYMFMTPILYEIRYGQSGLWANVSTENKAIADQFYGALIMMAVVVVAVLILWGFANANRQRAEEYLDE